MEWKWDGGEGVKVSQVTGFSNWGRLFIKKANRETVERSDWGGLWRRWTHPELEAPVHLLWAYTVCDGNIWELFTVLVFGFLETACTLN